ncbi:hypothetical protein H3146_05900 [Streptomyces sp. OF3]|uniref:Uncharacterized protein n=1 Tax=Streptomyces alkaliterrae TaxID=2213162 RepID=A0A7W3WJA0_9ACTN|nr:hypothetical protein [Streptomyces alkaliterrae]MBB1252900.1 hypothetical protein [Streptomyces alkaliterrae]
MDIDAAYAAQLKTALTEGGVELPWGDLEITETFWRAVDGLSVEQAVDVARAVRAGIEHGVISARQ